MEMIFHSHANKTHFQKKGCALGLILKVRDFGTRSGLLTTPENIIICYGIFWSGLYYIAVRFNLPQYCFPVFCCVISTFPPDFKQSIFYIFHALTIRPGGYSHVWAI